MEIVYKNKNQPPMKEPANNADHTSRDSDADKTGTDISSDSTEIRKEANEFDKPKREIDPDRTGIDIDSDKTKEGDPEK